MAVNWKPEGYHTLTLYLSVDDGAAAIDWYTQALGAKERMRMPMPDGRIGHAELEIGDSVLMLSEPMGEGNVKSPKQLGGTTGGAFVYVEDIDTAFKKAIDAGATSAMDPQDMFWGDRFGSFTDPFGHHWSFATHKEDLTEEEMAKRGQEAFAQMAGSTN